MRRICSRQAATLLVAVLAFAWPFGSAVAQGQDVRVVRGGQSIAVSRGAEIAAKLVVLAESSSVNSTASAVALETWANVLASESFVQVTFPEPRVLHLAPRAGYTKQQHEVHSLLLPLPVGQWPAYLFVDAGGKLASVTKFDPIALKRLVSEPELRLSNVEPYSSLTGAQRTR
jgi:hypothetical protein